MTQIHRQKRITAAIALALLAADAPPVFAQAPESARAGGLEQVIVNARRVEENVQEVPLAISAFSGEQMEKAGITTIGDLLKVAPSMQMAAVTGRKVASVFGIRGQKADDPALTQDQAIGVYIGGVAQGWPYGIGIAGTLDIASVEVAKGPQGTLFGKNTTGGAIIITPQEPNQSFEGRIKAGVGNYNLRSLDGMINTPLADTLALRVAAQGALQDGLVDNRDGGEDFNDTNDWGVRVSLKWTPTDALSSLFVFDQQKSSAHGGAMKLIAARNGFRVGTAYSGPLQAQSSEDFWSGHSETDGYMDANVWGFANTTTWEVSDQLTIKNIAAFRSMDVQTLVDLDGVNAASVGGLSFTSYSNPSAHQYTEELQLIGTTDIADWIVGLYYSRLDGRDGGLNTQPLSPPTSISVSGPQGGLVNESAALFGQSTWHLTDNLNLTTGLRGTVDNRQVVYTAHQSAPTFVCSLRDRAGALPNTPDGCRLKGSESFHEPTWNISLDYKLTDSQLIYAAHRHGYRSGGFPGRGIDPETAQPFDPEKVNDYEIGHKLETDLAGMPLRVNTAIFYQKYKDIQKNVQFILSNGQLGNTVRNAASATIKGGEIEFTFLPIDDLEITGALSYIDAGYDDWKDLINTGTAAAPVFVERDLSSTEFATTPQKSGNLTVRYHLPLPEHIGDVSASATVYAQSGYAGYFDNKATDCQPASQSGYSTYSARLDWDRVMGNGGLSISAWGKNLGEREYYTTTLCQWNTFGISMGIPADPRTYGLNVAYTF